jgi:GNAT superfamily N-acetyltransferase
MTNFAIRPATAADIPEIIHHRRAMFEDMRDGDPASLDAMAAATGPYLLETMAQDSYRGWLAVTPDGRVAGGVGVLMQSSPPRPWEILSRRAYILNMYVYPEHRRKGIARRLMETSLDWCWSEGFKTVSLHASQFGRPLYEAMGFEQTNEMRLKLK